MQISRLQPVCTTSAPALDVQALKSRYLATRDASRQLAAPLSAEDAMVQSMEDASPAKWHLAHTSWFFEHFVLGSLGGYQPWDRQWHYLFNSYYTSIGPAHARPQRGLLSRPGLEQVWQYREAVDAAVLDALDAGQLTAQALHCLLLGIEHECQHQELLLTDIKHAFWSNPLQPAYREELPLAAAPASPPPRQWLHFDEQVIEVGAARWPQQPAFAYDNESPRHRVLVPAHAIESLPVSNARYRQFIDAGGYREPRWWMSEGWALLQQQDQDRPLYWDKALEQEFTLAGWRDLVADAPVCHLSYYEADAFARWAGARLPTEFEWEQAAAGQPLVGNFVEQGRLHPQPPEHGRGNGQWFGDVWEWTSSAYGPYPGFAPLAGSAGEYNGKFMCGQWVLRGGSCASVAAQLRASYRNFFMPSARWQFSGLRLARQA